MADKTHYYCFRIESSSGKSLFLTSLPENLQYLGNEYKPFSGLNLVKHVQDDTAQNSAIIKGIFEKNGVISELDLKDSKVSVSTFFENELLNSFTYIVRKEVRNDLDFELYLEPESFKYSTRATKLFSKTCRANFCDKDCSLKERDYTKIYEVRNIEGKEIEIANLVADSGYYIGGKAIIYHDDGSVFRTEITGQYKGRIRVSCLLPKNLLDIKQIKLRAGCDKKFISCCKKFNNALNFRGEPFIPEFKVLKN